MKRQLYKLLPGFFQVLCYQFMISVLRFLELCVSLTLCAANMHESRFPSLFSWLVLLIPEDLSATSASLSVQGFSFFF